MRSQRGPGSPSLGFRRRRMIRLSGESGWRGISSKRDSWGGFTPISGILWRGIRQVCCILSRMGWGVLSGPGGEVGGIGMLLFLMVVVRGSMVILLTPYTTRPMTAAAAAAAAAVVVLKKHLTKPPSGAGAAHSRTTSPRACNGLCPRSIPLRDTRPSSTLTDAQV